MADFHLNHPSTHYRYPATYHRNFFTATPFSFPHIWSFDVRTRTWKWHPAPAALGASGTELLVVQPTLLPTGNLGAASHAHGRVGTAGRKRRVHASDEDMAAVARRCTTCRSMLPQDRFEGRRLRCRACVGRRHSGVGVKKKGGNLLVSGFYPSGRKRPTCGKCRAVGHIRTYCTSSAVGEAVVKVVGGDGDEEEDVGEGMVEVGGEGGGDEKDEGGETQEDYGDKEEYEEEFSEAEISG